MILQESYVCTDVVKESAAAETVPLESVSVLKLKRHSRNPTEPSVLERYICIRDRQHTVKILQKKREERSQRDSSERVQPQSHNSDPLHLLPVPGRWPGRDEKPESHLHLDL